ncbi:A24 family peptidase [Phenylobacterium immobile]|uniref:A24 family peptidase n=1 Tax=Phenylobacterium immobile TaxID=21 RepID=UPI000AB327CF|nr:prepilin peptidase [Phenylobacterium immobile]
MNLIHLISFLAFPALTIVAALYDATSYRIPNWISLAILALFAIAATTSGVNLPTIGLCVATGAAILVMGFGLFALRALGGGDAKLLAVSALWFGWPQISVFLLCTVLAGAILAVVLVVIRSDAVRPHLQNGPAWIARISSTGREMPYGIAIACGALGALPASPLA